MVRRLRERLRVTRSLIPLAIDAELLRWRAESLKRRVAYWARRAARFQAQLQEVSDEYPTPYVRAVRAARDHGLPAPRAATSRGPRRNHPRVA